MTITINAQSYLVNTPYAVKMKAKLNQTYTPAYEYSSITRLRPPADLA